MANPCVTLYHLPFKNIFHVTPRAALSLLQGYFFLEYELISIFRNQAWKTRHKLYFMCKLKSVFQGIIIFVDGILSFHAVIF